MSKAYVLMTAMPPTRGHLHLIQFAEQIADSAEVVLTTQPDEPYSFERLAALRDACVGRRVNIHHIHKALPQEPDGGDPQFWDMWLDFLLMFGLQPEDYIVASESYGAELARISGATFMPYDLERAIDASKATRVRENPREYFETILPQFQPTLVQRVTVFGAESTGKSTMSLSLADAINGHWLFEWARPYLETVGTEITDASMAAIVRGQSALQRSAADLLDKPFIVQDTDLFTTIGYYRLFGMQPPAHLVDEAKATQSDLYLLTQSVIDFEPDPLRYGGDERQGPDGFWLDLCDEFGLNYRVIESSDPDLRIAEASDFIDAHYDEAVHVGYKRSGREYQS